MEELRKADVLSYHPLQPSLTNSTQDPLSKCRGMEGTIITKGSLTITKLSHNVTCRVVRVMEKPNQRNIVILQATIDHVHDTPPFHHPLDT